MTPAETLRAAAVKVEALAAAAPAGPWRDIQNGWCIRSEPAADAGTWATVAESPNRDASPWMTMLDPRIAPALAAWLRAEADHSERTWITDYRVKAALALASVLLGDTTGEKPDGHV